MTFNTCEYCGQRWPESRDYYKHRFPHPSANKCYQTGGDPQPDATLFYARGTNQYIAMPGRRSGDRYG